MATQQGIIQLFMASLDNTTLSGTKALDEAIAYSTANKYSTIQEVINRMKNNIDTTDNAEKFLKTYCGIDLNNDDTGAITGLDAGGSQVKTAESIVPEEDDLVEFNDGSWFDNIEGQNGLTVQLVKRTGSLEDTDNITTRYFDELSEQEIYLWRATYTWWIRNGLNLIAESYGDNFSFDKYKSSATNKDRTLYIIFEKFDDDNALADTWGGPSYEQESTNNLVIRINLDYYGNATGVDGEVTNGEEHLDRTFAHELTHAVMRSNIDYYDYLPAFIKEGMAEITHGVDDVRTGGIKKLAENSSLLAKALSLKDYSPVTISGVNSPSYAGGYMFLRYLARQSGDLTINNKTANASIQTFYGDDNIINRAFNVTITSGDGNDSIQNVNENVTIYGDAGNDTLKNWMNKVTMFGGAGNDLIKNNSGESVSLDGGSGNDELHNWGNNIIMLGGAGNDSLCNHIYGGGSNVSIDGGANNDFVDNWGDNVTISGGAGDDTLHNHVNGSIGGGKNVIVDGGANNDDILNQGSFVTITGGAGDDSIKNTGSNVLFNFSSGDGFDTIAGINSKDTIAISGSNYYTKKTDGSNVTVSLFSGDGSITLTDAKGKTFNVEGSTFLNVIDNTKNSVKIKAAKGEDSIKNSGDQVTIVGASDVDSIWNYGDNVSLNGGSGSDRLDNMGNKVTVLGGKGNDTLRNDTYNEGAKNVKLDGGAGNDSIQNWGDKVTMLGGNNNDSLYNYANGSYSSGASVKMDGGSGADYLLNFGVKVTISGGDDNDTIVNYDKGYVNGELVIENGGKNSKIYGDAGNDSIRNDSTNVTISGGAGDDTITNNGANVKVDGGSGNDKLIGGTGNDSLNGGSGKDTLDGGKDNDKLIGGTGNDSLWGGDGADIFIYRANEGTDEIFDYASGDMLKILKSNGKAGGTFSDAIFGNKKLTLAISGGGSIIFSSVAKGDSFNINGTSYKISGKTLK